MEGLGWFVGGRWYREFCFDYVWFEMYIRFLREDKKKIVGYISLEFKVEVEVRERNLGVISE